MLELHEPEGAFDAPRGVAGRGAARAATSADVYLGYGLAEPLRRDPAPPPPEPCPLPLLAARSPTLRANLAQAWVPRSATGSRRGRRRTTPPRSTPCAPRSRAATSTRSNLVQHLSAPFERRPRRARGRARAASPAASAAARGRRLGDRLGVARALPRAPRRPARDDADQGHAPDRRGHRRREGRGRARDDRRSRAQRSLARLRAGHRALAGADGAARARRRDASRLDRRGAAAPGRRPRRDPARRRSRAARSPARRRSRRSTTSPALEPVGRGASMGALGVVQANGDFELALTIRTFAIADGPHPPLGRRRDRLGLRAGGGDRGVVGQGPAAARRGRRPRARMTLLAVAVAGRGLVDPATSRSSAADDEALLRGGAAFETVRVYDGRAVSARSPPRSASRYSAVGARAAAARRCARAGRARRRRRAARPRAAPLPDRAGARRDRPRRCRGDLDELRARGLTLATVEAGAAAASWPAQVDELRRGVRRPPRRRDADDALFVDDGAVVRECATANIWWRSGEQLYTPAVGPGRAAGRDALVRCCELAAGGARAASRSPTSSGRRGVHRPPRFAR